jgi:hypothetical protein
MPNYTCEDTDPGNYPLVQGETRTIPTIEISRIYREYDECGQHIDSTHIRDLDPCYENCFVLQKFCDANGHMSRVASDCAHGCRDGACLSSGSPAPTRSISPWKIWDPWSNDSTDTGDVAAPPTVITPPPPSECAATGNPCVDDCYIDLCKEGRGIINELLKSQCYRQCSGQSEPDARVDPFDACAPIVCDVDRSCTKPGSCITDGSTHPNCSPAGTPIVYFIDPCKRISSSQPYCGDGNNDAGEHCDGSDLGACRACTPDCQCR